MISIYDRLCISTLMSWCVCIRANTKILHSYCIAKHSRFLHYYQVICIDTGNIMQFCERLFMYSVCKKLHCFLTIAWFEVTECVRTVLQLLLESRTFFVYLPIINNNSTVNMLECFIVSVSDKVWTSRWSVNDKKYIFG